MQAAGAAVLAQATNSLQQGLEPHNWEAGSWDALSCFQNINISQPKPRGAVAPRGECDVAHGSCRCQSRNTTSDTAACKLPATIGVARRPPAAKGWTTHRRKTERRTLSATGKGTAPKVTTTPRATRISKTISHQSKGSHSCMHAASCLAIHTRADAHTTDAHATGKPTGRRTNVPVGMPLCGTHRMAPICGLYSKHLASWPRLLHARRQCGADTDKQPITDSC